MQSGWKKRRDSLSTVTLLFLVSAFTRPAIADDPADPPRRILRVFVLGEDGQPLAGARIHSSLVTKPPEELHNRDYFADEHGQVAISLPPEPDILRLWARRDGYTPMWAHWWMSADDDQTPIPDEFTFQLLPGTLIGGIVRDEHGEPIEGVTVEVQGDFNPGVDQPMRRVLFGKWLAEGDGAATTDAEGRWTLCNVPAGDDFKVLLKLTHPDYVSDSKWGELQQAHAIDFDALRERTATIVMPTGVHLRGNVSGPDGQAIPQAVVIWGDRPYWQPGSQEVIANDLGEFVLPALPAGPTQITVVARDWAPVRREIQLAPDQPPVEFGLAPGKTLRLRFVDADGNAVPGVVVTIDKWRGAESLYSDRHPNVVDLHIPIRADAAGIYEWTWAPDDAVTFNFYKEGFQSQESVSLVAGQGEQVITLQK